MHIDVNKDELYRLTFYITLECVAWEHVDVILFVTL